jgi:hypothetical protein
MLLFPKILSQFMVLILQLLSLGFISLRIFDTAFYQLRLSCNFYLHSAAKKQPVHIQSPLTYRSNISSTVNHSVLYINFGKRSATLPSFVYEQRPQKMQRIERQELLILQDTDIAIVWTLFSDGVDPLISVSKLISICPLFT